MNINPDRLRLIEQAAAQQSGGAAAPQRGVKRAAPVYGAHLHTAAHVSQPLPPQQQQQQQQHQQQQSNSAYIHRDRSRFVNLGNVYSAWGATESTRTPAVAPRPADAHSKTVSTKAASQASDASVHTTAARTKSSAAGDSTTSTAAAAAAAAAAPTKRAPSPPTSAATTAPLLSRDELMNITSLANKNTEANQNYFAERVTKKEVLTAKERAAVREMIAKNLRDIDNDDEPRGAAELEAAVAAAAAAGGASGTRHFDATHSPSADALAAKMQDMYTKSTTTVIEDVVAQFGAETLDRKQVKSIFTQCESAYCSAFQYAAAALDEQQIDV